MFGTTLLSLESIKLNTMNLLHSFPVASTDQQNINCPLQGTWSGSRYAVKGQGHKNAEKMTLQNADSLIYNMKRIYVPRQSACSPDTFWSKEQNAKMQKSFFAGNSAYGPIYTYGLSYCLQSTSDGHCILIFFCLHPSLYLQPGGIGPWHGWLTIILQCYDTVGWVMWPVKPSPKWPTICRVGR